MAAVFFQKASSDQDLSQIVALQKSNLPAGLTEEERRAQGFVTVVHTTELLADMNRTHQHIVAKSDDQVVGYALCMLRDFAANIPVLVPMFQTIEQLSWKERPLNSASWLVMGQICVAKEWRGKGVFEGMYQKMKETLSPHFEYCITEVDARNTRSLRAHEKVGFQELERYQSDQVEWVLIIWDWRNTKTA